MHIEPGVVGGAKLLLSYATAAGALGVGAKLTADAFKEDGAVSTVTRSLLTTLLVFVFFQVLPHFPVGVSEVHFILGSTLLLLFGVAPTALGLVAGLLIQGALFTPSDLPQFGVNVTTLLVPLFALALMAQKLIPKGLAYKDIGYTQVLRLSCMYQGGVIGWVAFWAFYGQGFGAENLSQVSSFSLASAGVVLVEPLVDLAVLFVAKRSSGAEHSAFVHRRLLSAIS